MNSLIHCFVVMTVIAIVLNAVQTPAAAESDAPVVRIRILDYAYVPTELMAGAQERVTDIYNAIGVHTQWLCTIRPLDASQGEAASIPEPRDLVVIVLSPSMSRRHKFARDVMGAAIVTPQDGGRVAYVLFDRVAVVAKVSGSTTTDIMGLVMAHEIGHLVLPYGSHAPSGLMQADWNVKELRTTSDAAFAFTSMQRAMIRDRLQRWASVPSANATQ